MVTDRGRSYDAKVFRRVKQQKCLAHLQRTLSDVLAHKKGRARDLAEGTRELLRFGARLWEEYQRAQTSSVQLAGASPARVGTRPPCSGHPASGAILAPKR
jgi:hypothetical protein